MSDTENTNVIDEKKNEFKNSNTTSDFKGFIKNYLLSIVFTIGIFIIGGIGLYTTKIAQSNILPDNIELAPYTVFDRIVNDKPIDINITANIRRIKNVLNSILKFALSLLFL